MKALLAHVPTRHEAFAMYVVLAGDSVRLCRMSALPAAKEVDSFGVQLRNEFDQLLNALTDRYGQPWVINELLGGSIWNGPRDFMVGLLKEERQLSAPWADSARLAGFGLQEVRLQAVANSSSAGSVQLVYDGINTTKCMDQLSRKRNKVL